jgi:hypothetical protein
MSQQCLWQNDHAILKGTTIILHNKKNVRTCKNKAAIKVIRFYYVMSAASFSAPNVPSDKGFYQLLWDDPDRSNRSLKRTAPPAPVSNTRKSRLLPQPREPKRPHNHHNLSRQRMCPHPSTTLPEWFKRLGR